MRLQFLLSEIWGGLRRNLSMIISVVLVSMVSLFFVGFSLLGQRQVDTAKGYWYDKIQVSVFMCTAQSQGVPSCADGAVTASQREQIRTDLQSLKPLVEGVYYESSDQAYQRFKEQFANSPYLSSVDKASMPSSFRVRLSDPQRAGEVVTAFQGAPGVEAVSDQRKVLETFFTLLNVVSLGAAGLAAIMLFCSVLLIATTIRQVAFTRRREVSIMRSVGASSTVVYLPFVLESVLAVTVGAGLAIVGLWATVHFGLRSLFDDSSGGLISVIGTSDVWFVAPGLLIGGILVAVLTSWLTLRRYLKV